MSLLMFQEVAEIMTIEQVMRPSVRFAIERDLEKPESVARHDNKRSMLNRLYGYIKNNNVPKQDTFTIWGEHGAKEYRCVNEHPKVIASIFISCRMSLFCSVAN